MPSVTHLSTPGAKLGFSIAAYSSLAAGLVVIVRLSRMQHAHSQGYQQPAFCVQRGRVKLSVSDRRRIPSRAKASKLGEDDDDDDDDDDASINEAKPIVCARSAGGR